MPEPAQVECPTCAGTGKANRYQVCTRCQGNGVIDAKKPDPQAR